MLEINLPEIGILTAQVAAVESLIREIADHIKHNHGAWWTKREYADALEVSLKTVQNAPWMQPPEKDGPTSWHVLRDEDVREYLQLTAGEMKARFAVRTVQFKRAHGLRLAHGE